MATTTGVNADLARERKGASFDSEQLTSYLYNGTEGTKRKRYIQNLALRDLEKHKFKQYVSLSREEQYEMELQKAAFLFNLQDRLGLTDPYEKEFLREAVQPHEPGPYNLHNSMFVDAISRLGTEEQKAKWLPLARSYRLVGTYAQTELGHGTFLRGLETTATYEPASKQFVINSPTITSTKYWPGALGKTSNCCIVMANLMNKGSNLGMHSFLVQIRDLDTHQPLKGVTVGDIGNKFGYGGIDNGFLRLNNVRIPLENMLMKHAKMHEDGTYVKPKNDRLMYGAMTFIRAAIVGDVGRGLAKAATISIRYSAVRRQSKIDPKEGEVQVLDFQTQQHRLFPQMATAFALMAAGRSMWKVYNQVTSDINKGKFLELPQLHALSAGLKSLSSWQASEGVEICRLACGGHGYSAASGLPKIYTDVTPACTYEGENYVMILQTARFLVKCMSEAQQGKELPSLVSFLSAAPQPQSRLDDKLELSALVAAFQHRTARMVQEAAGKVGSAVSSGIKMHQAWNSNAVELAAAARAFAEGYVVQAFAETLAELSGPLRNVMTALCRLYAITLVNNSLGDFLKDGFLSGEQAAMLASRGLDLLSELRPDAVALVDAFDFPDAVLDSALGRYDGNVYQALYDYSLRSKLNEKEVLDAYHKYQRPFMESQWGKGSAALTSRL